MLNLKQNLQEKIQKYDCIFCKCPIAYTHKAKHMEFSVVNKKNAMLR